MKKLKIFQTSDIHGNIYATNYIEPKNYGLAKINSAIKNRGIEANYTLKIDSGDILQGNSLAFFNHKNSNFNPSIIDGFNQMGYDAITLGNHEFNYGLDYLEKHYSKFDGDILCSNIKGLPFSTKPYQIYTFDNLKIGVIGFTTDFIPNWEKNENIKGLEFFSPVDIYAKYEDELKQQSDIIIVNYHGGFERSLDQNQTLTETDSSENVGSKLISTFDSIDIIFTGHQHRVISNKINNTICMQPGFNGSYVSEVTIDIENKQIIDFQLIDVSEYKQDDGIIDLFKEQHELCNDFLDTPLCTLDKDLTINNIADARRNSHPLLSLLGEAFSSQIPADFVALNLFDTAIGFKPQITIREVNQNYPFPNTLVKVRLTGKQMIKAIEQSANYYRNVGGEIIINPSYIIPKPKHFNFDMYWGLHYEVKIREDGCEVINTLVDGKPIDLDKEYSMLISNYRFSNREDYPIYNDVQFISESSSDAVELLLNYFVHEKHIQVNDSISYEFYT